MMRALGASRGQQVRWLYLYELAPTTLTALRQAVTTALVVAIVSEMVVGTARGLGTRAVSCQIAYDVPGLYAAMITAGALGLALSAALLSLERRVVSWSP